jgi:hypothetical protein
MSNIFALIQEGRGGVKFIKYFNWDAKCKNLETSGINYLPE